MFSTFEGIGINASPFANMLATYGFDQLSAQSGMYSYPLDTWGPTFAPVKQVQSTIRSVNTVSADYAEWPLPTGAQSAVLNYIAWGDGSSADVMGITASGDEVWCNRVAWGSLARLYSHQNGTVESKYRWLPTSSMKSPTSSCASCAAPCV